MQVMQAAAGGVSASPMQVPHFLGLEREATHAPARRCAGTAYRRLPAAYMLVPAAPQVQVV
jgi:hypothetical protein